MAETTKLAVSVSTDVADEVKALAAGQGVTVTEWFRRATALYKFVLALGPDDKLLVYTNGDVQQVILIP